MSAIRSRHLLQWLLGVIAVAIFTLASAGSAFAEVTGAADNLRTGWYPDEPSLTPALLSGGGFQQVFKDSLQGQIYAQPLTADGVLLVATEDNWIYGLNPVTGAHLWAKEVGTPVNTLEAPIECTDLEPRLGITGTPVIDTEHNIAYFVSTRYTKEGAEPESGWYMHAVELTSGKEVANFPVKIEGEAQNLPGLQFEPFKEMQRPALLMMEGVVYAGPSTPSSARAGTCSPPANSTTISAETTSANATPAHHQTPHRPARSARTPSRYRRRWQPERYFLSGWTQ